ncbi:hypothetical protein AMTR_s00129p00067300 [Amborella trichopoda]|uniref:DUF659 domain-containing protein n=1 Tax=Amborella trichopoda TaxID=13333 RepID=W1NJQ6_AMBTC|nr:hypothetical protein AMTR_s00129p00067300 [Amborella trichopoda]
MTLKSMVKGTRNMLGTYIGKWLYVKGTPFDAANSPYFSPMVNAIQRARPGVKPSTAYELNGSILDEEVEEVRKWIEEYKRSWPRTGIILMSDGWLNKVNKKEFVNFLAYSPKTKLMDERKHLVWIDLMVEEISEIKIVKVTLQEARLVSRFIYNHSKILFLFRERSKKKEIIRPAITRFATDYLAVDFIREYEGAIKRLFTSEE